MTPEEKEKKEVVYRGDLSDDGLVNRILVNEDGDKYVVVSATYNEAAHHTLVKLRDCSQDEWADAQFDIEGNQYVNPA